MMINYESSDDIYSSIMKRLSEVRTEAAFKERKCYLPLTSKACKYCGKTFPFQRFGINIHSEFKMI